jgi:glycosyltransferase involved in cell wall biosynthesis
MRWVILTQYFYPEVGAAPIRFYEIARELTSRGYQVTVVTTFPSHRMVAIPKKYRRRLWMREEMEGFKVLRVWAFPHFSGRIWKRFITYFSFVFTSIFGIMRAGSCDYILVHSPPLFIGISAYISSLLKRAPFIFSVSDLWPQVAVELGVVRNKWLIRLAERLELFIYRKAWKVVAVSDGIYQALLSKGLPKEKVSILSNGANIEMFALRKKRKDLIERYNLQSKKVFLYAGNFGFAFDPLTILKAAEILLPRNEIFFLLVGDGPEKAGLQELARRKSLSNVLFVTSKPFTEIPDYYALSLATIVPLKKSNFPKTHRPARIYASMACQKPIIYCGDGEPVGLIKKANCGVVVEPENPKALAEKIIEMVENPSLVKKLGQNGREFVVKNYAWDSLISQWLNEVGLPQKV